MHISANEIVERVVQRLSENFADGKLASAHRTYGTPAATKDVKKCIGDLGRELDFQVAACGYVGANDSEWLYDMVWYVLDNGIMLRQALALECEWNPYYAPDGAPTIPIDTDFQKLVQARADVRVWITIVGTPEQAELQLQNCQRQIERFSDSKADDKYILVVTDWASGRTRIERYTFNIC